MSRAARALHWRNQRAVTITERILMISGSENFIFPSSKQNSPSYRLSTNNTGPFSPQHTTPNFLFGSRSRRRSLILSFDSSASEKRTSSQMDTISSPLPSKSSSQSSKSVHWSPSLTETKSIHSSSLRDDFYMDTDPDNSSSKGPEISRASLVNVMHFIPSFLDLLTLNHVLFGLDPPLRSMMDELISPQLLSLDGVPTDTNTPSILDSQVQQEIAAHWITVFGFSREDATNVLKLFARHGTVVAHRFPREGNWMYLRYASPIHAQQALSRNGQIIDGRLRLGVLPVDNKELINLEEDEYGDTFSQIGSENGIQFSQSRSILSENSLYGVGPVDSSTAISRLDTSFNSSLISSPVRPGIRSLRASFNTIDNYYRVDEETQPEKSYGLLDKLWSFVS
uniref:Nucleoporin NUP35 n=1 Tax=Setaria digitata TaxID=48799 RepID=A0A915PZY5_9BILA